MSMRRLASVLLAVSISACQTAGPRPDGVKVFNAQKYTCTSANQCTITVTANAQCSSPYDCPLDRDPIHLQKGYNNVDITWQLPANSVFCTALGDGVFLKTFDYDEQFDQMMESGNASGPKKKCKDAYHWRGKNTVSK